MRVAPLLGCIAVASLAVGSLVVASVAFGQGPGTAAAAAQATSPQGAGKVTRVAAPANVVRGAKTIPASVDQAVQMSDVLKTGPDGRVRVVLNDGSILVASSNAQLTIVNHDEANAKTTLELKYGYLRATVVGAVAGGPTPQFEVRTRTAVCGVLGTQFEIETDDTATQTHVYEGTVNFTDSQSGQKTNVERGQSLHLLRGVRGFHQGLAPRFAARTRQRWTSDRGEIQTERVERNQHRVERAQRVRQAMASGRGGRAGAGVGGRGGQGLAAESRGGRGGQGPAAEARGGRGGQGPAAEARGGRGGQGGQGPAAAQTRADREQARTERVQARDAKAATKADPRADARAEGKTDGRGGRQSRAGAMGAGGGTAGGAAGGTARGTANGTANGDALSRQFQNKGGQGQARQGEPRGAGRADAKSAGAGEAKSGGTAESKAGGTANGDALARQFQNKGAGQQKGAAKEAPAKKAARPVKPERP